MTALTFDQILIRLCLAAAFGGILGMEREVRRRPAGFRTYTLVCIGSAIAIMTNAFLAESFSGDASRIGAQVVSGIGFLGAGTILITGRNQVKGLTTAAGLWACACMGLAIGAGFYTLAITGCIFIFIVLSALQRLDHRVFKRSNVMEVYIEMEKEATLSFLLRALKEENIRIGEMQPSASVGHTIALTATLTLGSRLDHEAVVQKLMDKDGIAYIEEL